MPADNPAGQAETVSSVATSQSIRTSDPIEFTFGTIRHRTKRSKGCLTRGGMLHIMFKLGQYGQQNWRRQRGFEYFAQVIIGVKFRDGIEVTESN